MFTANMSWPMTIAPTNEAIGGENDAKNLVIGKKKYCHDPGGHVRCKGSNTTNKRKVL